MFRVVTFHLNSQFVYHTGSSQCLQYRFDTKTVDRDGMDTIKGNGYTYKGLSQN